RLDAAQADQPCRLEHRGFHHQHQRGAAAANAHRLVAGIQQFDRRLQRPRLRQLKRVHAAPCAEAAPRFFANCISMPFALALSTGCPMLPSLPVSAVSISCWIVVPPAESLSRVDDVAVKRPTSPIGAPSIFAAIRSGAVISVNSTVTLNLKVM